MAAKTTRRRKPIGRPTKFTEDTTKAILDALNAGNYNDDACHLAGIAPATFYAWLDRGKAERDRLAALPDAEPDPAETPYAEFSEAVERAKAAAVARNVAIIQKAALNTWQAAAWWLERTNPRKFARMEKAELTGPEGGAVRIDVSTEDLERKIGRILERREQP